MQKQRGDAWQRHHNNRAGISTSPWKSRCFDTRLNPASDPRVASCLGEAGVDAQAQLLAAASPELRDSPILRCWPCLSPLPCCCQWDGAHSSPRTGSGGWVCHLTRGRSGSAAGSRGHHYGHHHQLSLRPPAATSPVTGAVPVPHQHRRRSTGITRAAPALQAASTSRGTGHKEQRETRNNCIAVFLWNDRSLLTHTHVLTASLSITHKAYRVLSSSSSSSPSLGAQGVSHARLSTSTTPAASG